MIDLGSRGRIFSALFAALCIMGMAGCAGVSTAKNSSSTNNPSGTPAQLSALNSTLNFGSVQLGSSQSQSATVMNSGAAAITISQAIVSGAGFSLKPQTLPLNLSTGQSAVFLVTFSPQGSGAASGSLAITSNASNSTLNITLSGTGLAPGSLAPNPGSLDFGQVQVGASSSKSATLTNSGGSTITVSQLTISGSGFNLSGLSAPLTLGAGQSSTFQVSFSPQSAGAAGGNIAILSTATNSSLNVPLTGTAVNPGLLGATPGSIGFGTVAVGSTLSLSVTLKNSGGSSLQVSNASVSGSGFAMSGLSLPLTLAAGQSKAFNVTFAPTAATTASGTVSITSNASNPLLTISLSGTGTVVPGQLSVAPGSITFSNVTVGTSQSQSGTLSASTAAVTVSSISGLSGTEFSVSGLKLPITIPAGGTASFTVTFTPQASGSTSATASFASNASNTPATQSLSGSGVAPIQHTVALSWTASTSVVVGYNVYRGTQSGGPYTKINSVLQAPANYTDSTVQSGQTYYYVTTAVDSNSAESGYSNEVQAAIPTP